MKKVISSPWFWIIVAAALPTLTLLHPGLPATHDGQDHVARIANFYADLKDKTIVPRWAANLNWGYGHPILMFLYPLPEYAASLFHAVGFNLIDSTKIVFGLSFIASAAAMYLWMASAWGMEAGVISGLLYTFAPYRFVDFYVRGDIGEQSAFVFPPLIGYFLWRLAKTKRFSRASLLSGIGLTLSVACLILAHNAFALMFIPILGLYALFLLITESKKKLAFTIIGVISLALGFAASAFFWIPALLEGKFTLREIVTAGEALQRFVHISELFYTPWNYGGTDTLPKYLGFAQWAGIVASLYIFFGTKKYTVKVLLAGLSSILLISFFIMLPVSAPVWKISKLLMDFQFPWRFLAVSTFVAAVLGGVVCYELRVKKNTLVIIAVVIILSTVYMWFPKGYQVHDDSFYAGIYPGTTDTGESSPIWSVRFMEHTPANHMDVGEGDVIIREVKRTTKEHDYSIDVRKPSLLVENTLYFPGWMIYLNNLATGIEWQNPTYRGLMTFRVTPGNGQSVRVVLEDTKVRKYADWLSLTAFAVVLLTTGGALVWQERT